MAPLHVHIHLPSCATAHTTIIHLTARMVDRDHTLSQHIGGGPGAPTNGSASSRLTNGRSAVGSESQASSLARDRSDGRNLSEAIDLTRDEDLDHAHIGAVLPQPGSSTDRSAIGTAAGGSRKRASSSSGCECSRKRSRKSRLAMLPPLSIPSAPPMRRPSPATNYDADSEETAPPLQSESAGYVGRSPVVRRASPERSRYESPQESPAEEDQQESTSSSLPYWASPTRTRRV